MDEYMKLAGAYFNQFEGRQLYPGWRSPLPWMWLISLALWLHALLQFVLGHFSWKWSIPHIVVTEIIFIFFSVAIAEHKKKSIMRAFHLRFGGEMPNIRECRRLALNALCPESRGDFLKVAKECTELQSLKNANRAFSDMDMSYWARKVYDPESKGRLISIFLAGVALCVALLVKSLPQDSTSLIEVLVSGSVFSLSGKMMGYAFVFFLIWLGLKVIALTLFDGILLWATKITKRSGSSETALRYFVRDLVRLHIPQSGR